MTMIIGIEDKKMLEKILNQGNYENKFIVLKPLWKKFIALIIGFNKK